jgi:hypothetical protein
LKMRKLMSNQGTFWEQATTLPRPRRATSTMQESGTKVAVVHVDSGSS